PGSRYVRSAHGCYMKETNRLVSFMVCCGLTPVKDQVGHGRYSGFFAPDSLKIKPYSEILENLSK
ncbi:MAG: hypothetical protein MI799_01245, partial [Desulfobacterales bacterium]|nr:hypothetical protein [Desulfobacterales bacterium]